MKRKTKLLVLVFILLIPFISCRKEVKDGRPEFIGYWSGGAFVESGYIYIIIHENDPSIFKAMDYENNHEYHAKGTARADDKKLTFGGVKFFDIIEYPHIIDTTVEQFYVHNHSDGTYKLANWEMVLDGPYNSINSNVHKHTYYKADY